MGAVTQDNEGKEKQGTDGTKNRMVTAHKSLLEHLK